MPVFDVSSQRQRRSRDEVPDVYQYDIPQELRVQVIYILEDTFGALYYNRLKIPNGGVKAYEFIHKALCRKYGMLKLGKHNDSDREAIVNFLLQTKETEKAIDVIEISFQVIDHYVRENEYEFDERKMSPDRAIGELNRRFRERGVGYQYESGEIIQVDSQLIHSEVVRPALTMLSDLMYKGANAEFLSAHEHYRKRRHKECLNDCLKAFESCIKAICEKRGWPYGDSDGASRLVSIVFERKLIPTFMQSHFSALRNTLEAGVPTVRNRLSGHGQGRTEVPVPESIAGYALHLTASNILLLARANEEMK